MKLDAEAYYQYLEKTDRASSLGWIKGAISGFENWLIPKSRTLNTFKVIDVDEYIRTGFSASGTANNFKTAILGLLKHTIISMDEDDPECQKIDRVITKVGYLKVKRDPKEYKKISLDVEEVRRFLKLLEKVPEIHSLGMVLAFTGARPIEVEKEIGEAKIDWSDRSLIIKGAKTKRERYWCWPKGMDEHFHRVVEAAPCPYAGEYFTKAIAGVRLVDRSYLNSEAPESFKMTSKVLRKTFQTVSLADDIPEYLIDAVMGHETGKISEIYTDSSSSSFVNKLREFMTKKHYMVRHKII